MRCHVKPQSLMFKKYFNLNTSVVLAFVVLVELLYTFVLKDQLLTNKNIYDSFAEQAPIDQVDLALKNVQDNFWLLLALAGLKIVAEIFLISACINLVTLLLKMKVTFTQLFGVVTKAFVVFSIVRIFLMIRYNVSGVQSFADLDSTGQLSIYSLFSNTDFMPTWLALFTQTLNVVSLAFIVLATVGTFIYIKRPIGIALGVVAGSYLFYLAVFSVVMDFVAMS